MPARPGCTRCGGVKQAPLYNTYTSSAVSNEKDALVKFKGGVTLDSRRILMNETVRMAYSVIAGLLSNEGNILYFLDKDDRDDFLIDYPAYSGYAL